MKNIVNSLVVLLILGYVVYCEFFRTYTDYEIHTEYIRIDTTIYRDSLVPYEVEVPTEVEVATLDTIWQMDTVYIKQFFSELYMDYNTTRKYSDTLDLDTLGIIVSNSVINQNKLQSVNFGVGLIIPKYTATTIDRNWGVGLMGGYNSLSPSVVYTRPRFHYIGSYNLIRNELQGGLIYRF